MTKPHSTWKKGQSGNPSGRPRKERAWAALIEEYGRKSVTLYDGSKVPAQDVIAKLTVMGLVTGKVVFPRLQGDQRKPRIMTLEPGDWIRFLGKTRDHLEGGPEIDVDIRSDGEALENVILYIPDNGRTKGGDNDE